MLSRRRPALLLLLCTRGYSLANERATTNGIYQAGLLRRLLAFAAGLPLNARARLSSYVPCDQLVGRSAERQAFAHTQAGRPLCLRLYSTKAAQANATTCKSFDVRGNAACCALYYAHLMLREESGWRSVLSDARAQGKLKQPSPRNGRDLPDKNASCWFYPGEFTISPLDLMGTVSEKMNDLRQAVVWSAPGRHKTSTDVRFRF